MRSILLNGIAAVGVLTLTSCATVKCPACQPLPVAGTYRICSVDAEGAKHIQPDDKVLIGRIGNVTNVAFGPKDNPTKTRLQLFQGTRGLVGWVPRTAVHDDHVIAIGTLELPRDTGGCRKGTAISIEFEAPDSDGKYRGARSGPHYGHAHGQIESITVPDL